jgi:chromosome segregation ATPase
MARQETETARGQVLQEQQRAAYLEGEIGKLAADRDHWRESAAKLQERLTTQDQDFTRLREGLDQQIQQQRELLDEVAKQLRYWEGVVRKRDSRVGELEAKASDLQRELLEAQGHAATSRREIERLNAALAAKEQQVAELTAWGERVRTTFPYKVYKYLKRAP